MSKILVIDEQDIAWAAGFFEGEGHIKLSKNKKTGRQWLQLEIAQVHREPLDKFKYIFDMGKVYGPYGPYKTQKQPYYMYMAHTYEVEYITDKLLPWLFHKGVQVKTALLANEEYQNAKQAA